MKIRINLSLEKISIFIKKYHFLILGVVLFLLLSFNFFIYYKHVYVIMNININPVNDGVVIDEDILKKVIDNINERKENLIRVKTENYHTPFNN